MTTSKDLIVIGAGMAGIAAANKCAGAGWSVGIVDELPYGGTCALRGCDPKKCCAGGPRSSTRRPSCRAAASRPAGLPSTGPG